MSVKSGGLKLRVAFRYAFAALAMCGLISEAVITTPAAAAPIDENLYTTYQLISDNSSILWITCGSVKQSEGCYTGGTLSPFTKVCALMESEPVYGSHLAARQLYVLDIGQTTGSNVILWVYRKTDTISSTYDSTVFKLEQSINLPPAAGQDVSCFMAANPAAIFVGTSASTNAVEIWRSGTKFTTNAAGMSKSPWAVDVIRPAASQTTVSLITANNRGFVSVSFGGNSPNGGIYEYGPNGAGLGGGGSFANTILPNTLNAVSTN